MLPEETPLTVFVLTRNRVSDLRRCLDSVVPQMGSADELFVLVNGTEDETVEVLAREYPQARVQVEHENHGCPGGRNIGIGAACHPWVLCVDDDGWLPEGSLGAARAAVVRVPQAAIIGGPVVEKPSEWPEGSLRRVGLFTGGICVLNRDKFLAFGGYHVDGLRQGEETELAIRLHDGGEEIWHEPRMRLVHAFDHSPAKRREILRAGTRQALLSAVKSAPAWFLIPYAAYRWLSFVRVGVSWRQPLAVLQGTGDAIKLCRRAARQRKPVSWSSLMAVSGRGRWS